jgi:hypothetical protein
MVLLVIVVYHSEGVCGEPLTVIKENRFKLKHIKGGARIADGGVYLIDGEKGRVWILAVDKVGENTYGFYPIRIKIPILVGDTQMEGFDGIKAGDITKKALEDIAKAKEKEIDKYIEEE